MINLIRNKYNLILGILVGIFLVQIVVAEGSAIIANKENSEFINSAWSSREKDIEDNKHELITNISHDLKTPLTSIVAD